MSRDRAPRLRLFFFGAHKLLVATELQRLRHLGYEVFNPPYLSNVLDQSAQTIWDHDQETTLPPCVFEKLSRYNFFYSPISEEIADLLRTYFDAAVVTIVARWAMDLARVFDGPIIFRAYGQTHLLSEDFRMLGGRAVIERHGKFHFCPHAAETIDGEEAWLRDQARVIPYCLSEDIFDDADRWDDRGDRSGEIIVTAPNIRGNIFHAMHYYFLKEFFYQPHFRFGGVQMIPVIGDHQVIGALSRSQQIEMFLRASGYCYTYSDPRVCYLPPIEMMVLGGPVVYMAGSLLARYIGAGGPGEATTVSGARALCDRLRQSDRGLIDDIRASQRDVRRRYTPNHVWPIFDAQLDAILSTISPRKIDLQADRAASIPPAERLARFLGAAIVGYDVAQIEAMNDDHVGRIADGLQAIELTRGDSQATQRDLREGGSAAAVRGMHKRGELSLRGLAHLVNGTESVQVRRRLADRNFLHDGSYLPYGAWERDDATGDRVRSVERGRVGCVAYGPYAVLAPGSYRAVFEIQADRRDDIGQVDVAVGGEVLADATLDGTGDFAQTSIDFDLAEWRADVEFRIWSNGSARLRIGAIFVTE